MRTGILLFFTFLTVSFAEAQKDRPRIEGQHPVSTDEDQPVTIEMTDLIVRDRDNWFYPIGFTMTLYPGENYSINGHIVTPATNFNGVLRVPVTVNDGHTDSKPYELQVEVRPVNDIPVITGQSPISTNENQAFTIGTSDLIINDPDDNSFTMIVSSGSNYTANGNTITPSPGFEGILSVPVQVNDGHDSSTPFPIEITVIPTNSPPVITGQKSLAYNEDQSFAINLTDLVVSDSDNQYPDDFTLKILPGNDYTFNQNVITPRADFSGTLTVSLLVNDGRSDSQPYGAKVSIININDPPKLINLEADAINYAPGGTAISVTNNLEATDPDNDSLASAEIGVVAQTRVLGYDQLKLEGTFPSITGSFDQSAGILKLTGKASKSEYTKALRSIRYNFVSDGESFAEGKKIYFKISDGKLESELVEREIRTREIDIDLDIPSAFTPNGDHANDTWVIRPIKQTEELSNAIVRVYHKSGALLFETAGFEKSWDGRSNGELMPADSYFFTIDFGDAFRKSAIKGVVTLLR